MQRVSLLPFDSLNVYLIGSVLVDAGATMTRRKLLRALEGRELTAHVLTHAHPDHQGASAAVCSRWNVPLMCGEGDRDAMETGSFAQLLADPGSLFARMNAAMSGPPHPVERTLAEGDAVGDFTVVETPGHTPGHVSFWRESDGVMILGDTVFNRNPMTLEKGLQEPLRSATVDRPLNVASARRVAALEPRLICFGHGAPESDGARFADFVARLPG